MQLWATVSRHSRSVEGVKVSVQWPICTVCSVQCSESSVQCSVFSVQYAVCSMQYAVCSMQYAVCSVQCAVCSVLCAVYSVQCAVCSVQCEMFSVQCAVFSALCRVQCLASVRTTHVLDGEIAAFPNSSKNRESLNTVFISQHGTRYRQMEYHYTQHK